MTKTEKKPHDEGYMKLCLISLVIGVVILSVIVVSSFITLIFLSKQDYTQSFSKKKSSSHTYQHLQYDQEKNETIFGIVGHPRNLQLDEFISTEKNGHYSLIYPFGSRAYKCYGRCHCQVVLEKEDEISNFRRFSLSTKVKITLYVVFVASAIAGKLYVAKKVGRDCEIEMSKQGQSCEPGTIEGEIEECVPFFKIEEEEEEEESESQQQQRLRTNEESSKESEEESKEEEELEYIRYVCHGECSLLPFFWLGYALFVLDMEDKEIDLTNTKQLIEIEGDNARLINYFISRFVICDDLSLKTTVIATSEEQAKKKFEIKNLRSYCRKSSSMDDLDVGIWSLVKENVGGYAPEIMFPSYFCSEESSGYDDPEAKAMYEEWKGDIPQILCVPEQGNEVFKNEYESENFEDEKNVEIY